MTHAEFTAALEPMATAWPNAPMTPTRAEALWRAFQHYSLSAWSAGVWRACQEARPPTGDKLLAFVDQAAEQDRGRRVARERQEPAIPRRIPDDAGDRDYGQFRLDLLRAVIFKSLSRQDVARRLEEAVASGIFPAQEGLMRTEIAEIREGKDAA